MTKMVFKKRHAGGKGDALAAVNCFAMAAINVPFIAANPTGAVWNWVSAVVCLGIGIACTAMNARR